jgi:hypothetical protein
VLRFISKEDETKRACRGVFMEFTKVCCATFLSAALAVFLTSPANVWVPVADHGGEALVVAQGILVQPNVGDLEPPSIADEQQRGGQDEGGERVPAEIQPEPGMIRVVPAVPESRQQEMERPGARQQEMERGGGRQEDLELPEGPGTKY